MLLRERGLLDEALEAAAAAGIEQVVSVGLDLEDSDRNRELAEAHPGVFFTVGWHPHERSAPDAGQMRALDELLRHPRAVAVGEVGLDRYWRPGYHEVPIEVQRRSFRMMLELAATHRRPVVIHDREAHAEVLAEIDAVSGTHGLMHCFSGDGRHARDCVARGFVCSFAGTVTFPRSESIQEAARVLPDGAWVVETDAPFLAPVPHRGRVNQPAYVAATAAAVARLRGASEADARAQASATARRVLRLPDPSSGDRVGGAVSASP